MRIFRFRRSRREFLAGCGQAAAFVLAPRPANSQTAGAEFHLHPNYREKSTLEPVLHKRNALYDDFPLEREHDRIAAILATWCESLKKHEQRSEAAERVLAGEFVGSSFEAIRTKTLRQDSWLEARELQFESAAVLDRDAFLKSLNAYLRALPELLVAEMQVTSIASEADGVLVTNVHYELVGTGTGWHREQRIGEWQLQWKNRSGEYALTNWQQRGETQARSKSPVYQDVTAAAFGHNSSYSAQLLHGVDYWRSMLDAASRIDIYGHNGVAVGDSDGNGLDDVYVCQPAGLPNRLYRNRGDGTFEDVTEAAGVGVLENTACALFADFSNTGRQDLLVVRANGPLLFVNDGHGKFRVRTDAFRFSGEPQGTFTGAAAADYDRDGRLDVYFCLYVYYLGTDQYKYPTPYYDANNGPPNILMRNNGDGTFYDVTTKAGLDHNNTRYSFCCGWTDINDDGWPDLYVVNDFGRKNLYRNNGDGTFTDVAAQSGTEDVGAGMSVCAFDYDNDGRQDLYVADMWTPAGVRITAETEFRKNSTVSSRPLFRKHAMGNSLFRNEGNGTFVDRTTAAGVGMGRWSWSSDTWDFDHDGYPDLYVTNGMISGPVREDLNSFFWRQVAANSPDDASPSRAYEQGWNAVNELVRNDFSWSGFERNVFYASNRDGRFADVSGVVGLDFLEDSRAFALADFDGDGRLEVLLKNRNGPQLRLLKNQLRDLPPSISFRLQGTKSNRDAIGATLTIETSRGKQTRMLQAGSAFLSQHSKEMFFGLGESTGPIRASVRWPGGLIQSFDNLAPGHKISLTEGNSSYQSEPHSAFAEATVRPQEQEGETLPDQVQTWLLSAVTAPDFSLADQTGAICTLASFRGRPVLLYLGSSESDRFHEQVMELDSSREGSAASRLAPIAIDFNRNKNAREHRYRFPVLSASDEVAAVYNLLYRVLFDRHRDLTLPASLLIDESSEIVKIYQGPLDVLQVERDCRSIPASRAERLAKALPFRGNGETYDFGRNHLSLGSTFFQRGYLEQAEAWFQLALRDDPSSAEAHYGLGSVYLKQNNLAAARAGFEQAVKLKASYANTRPDAWNNLGLIAIREGRSDEAVGYFKEALQIDPGHVISLENLGSLYRQQKRWDDAQREFEHALQLAPDEPEVNYGLGMVFAQKNEPDRAYALLQRALALRPDYPEARNNLGVLYLRTQRRDQAVAEFENCIRIAPAFDQSYLNLARVYLIEGDPERARATLLSLLREHPDHPEAQRILREIK